MCFDRYLKDELIEECLYASSKNYLENLDRFKKQVNTLPKGQERDASIITYYLSKYTYRKYRNHWDFDKTMVDQ